MWSRSFEHYHYKLVLRYRRYGKLPYKAGPLICVPNWHVLFVLDFLSVQNP
jgi:hypothetical protein